VSLTFLPLPEGTTQLGPQLVSVKVSSFCVPLAFVLVMITSTEDWPARIVAMPGVPLTVKWTPRVALPVIE